MDGLVCALCAIPITNSSPFVTSCLCVYHPYCLHYKNLYQFPRTCPSCEILLPPCDYKRLAALHPLIIPDRTTPVHEHYGDKRCEHCGDPLLSEEGGGSYCFSLWICEHLYHMDCLRAWIVEDGNQKCEVCDVSITAIDREYACIDSKCLLEHFNFS